MVRNIWAVRIEKLREASGETQLQVAEGVSAIFGKEIKRETINQWESGSRQIKAEAIKALAQHFNCSADYLLGLSDVPTSNKDLSFVCEYTGLSQDAIQFLSEAKSDNELKYFINFLLTAGASYIWKTSNNLFEAIASKFMDVYKDKLEIPEMTKIHSDGKIKRAEFYNLDDAFDFYIYRAKDSFRRIIDEFICSPQRTEGNSDAE